MTVLLLMLMLLMLLLLPMLLMLMLMLMLMLLRTTLRMRLLAPLFDAAALAALAAALGTIIMFWKNGKAAGAGPTSLQALLVLVPAVLAPPANSRVEHVAHNRSHLISPSVKSVWMAPSLVFIWHAEPTKRYE